MVGYGPKGLHGDLCWYLICSVVVQVVICLPDYCILGLPPDCKCHRDDALTCGIFAELRKCNPNLFAKRGAWASGGAVKI